MKSDPSTSWQSITGLREIVDRFDAFLLDLWGTVHDGERLYPGVLECFRHLRECGKSICLLSNVPRRCASIIDRLEEMGLPRDTYDHIVTSGEAVYQELNDRRDEEYRGLGERFYHLGPERDRDVFSQVEVFREVCSPQEADFILNTGPADNKDSLENYQTLLDYGVTRGLPMICANPDLTVLIDGQHEIICAGTLAQHYQKNGGRVIYRGKPYASIYEWCFRCIGEVPRTRIIAIGDNLFTDVRGANDIGIVSGFIPSSIHRKDLDNSNGDFAEFIRKSGHIPTYFVTELVW